MLVDLGRPAVQSASSVAAERHEFSLRAEDLYEREAVILCNNTKDTKAILYLVIICAPGFTPAPGASVGASSGKPPSLPVLHAARQMLELAHELYEQGHSQGLAHGQAQDPCAKGGSGLARQNEDTQKEAGQQQLQLGGEGEKQILQGSYKPACKVRGWLAEIHFGRGALPMSLEAAQQQACIALNSCLTLCAKKRTEQENCTGRGHSPCH
eukprot:1160911-Pelagomonas_calceolata.AAC.9